MICKKSKSNTASKRKVKLQKTRNQNKECFKRQMVEIFGFPSLKRHFKNLISITLGFSATYLAQFLIRRMASMLVSGNIALQANSDKHFTASWNESMMAAKCFSNTVAEKKIIIIHFINISVNPAKGISFLALF